jgi:hypothetical protein
MRSASEYCKLIGGEADDTMFDIPYEALTGSNDLQQFILTQSTVSMATLRRAVSKELNTLRFRECHFNAETHLYTPIKCIPLIDLCFADCVNLPRKLVASTIEHCPNLQRLNLWNVSAVSDSIFITVALHLPQLKVLYARCDLVTDVGVLAIARACFKLQDVIVTNRNRWCSISDRSVLELEQNCPHLQALWLDSLCGISSEVLRAIICCKLDLRTLGVASMRGVANALVEQLIEACPRLTDLSLPRGCYTCRATLEHIAATCKSLLYLEYREDVLGTNGYFHDGVEVVRVP